MADSQDDGLDADCGRDVRRPVGGVGNRVRNVVIAGGDDPVWPRSGLLDKVLDSLAKGGYMLGVIPGEAGVSDLADKAVRGKGE